MKINGVLTKSDNAIDAEDNGRYPMSQAKRQLKSQLAHLTLRQCQVLLDCQHEGEWHHVGKYANEVRYYDVGKCVEWYQQHPDEAAEILREVRPSRNDVREVAVRIEWTEWSGSRNHPTADNYSYEGPATIKGDWITFADGGKKRRKKISGNWINVTIQ